MLKIKENGADPACIATDEGELVKATNHTLENSIKPLPVIKQNEQWPEQWPSRNLPTYEHLIFT